MKCAVAISRIAAIGTLALLATATPSAHAAPAHVHGVATLQAATDGNRLVLDFYSPLDDLVGFEHSPRNDKQIAAVRRMAERLHKAEVLFIPTAEAHCARTSVNLESPALSRSLLAGDVKAQQPDAASRASEKNAKASRGQHAGLSAEIVFRCERPEKLSGLEVKVFDAFPNLKRIDVQVAGPKKQLAASLTTRNRRVSW